MAWRQGVSILNSGLEEGILIVYELQIIMTRCELLLTGASIDITIESEK
jgi:hypothetical protein